MARRKYLNIKRRKRLNVFKKKQKPMSTRTKRERFHLPDGTTISQLKQEVIALQSELAVAVRKRESAEVTRLTNKILRSPKAQYWAVYRTISSTGARSKGLSDKDRPTTNVQYYQLRNDLWQIIKNPKSYKATPLKRIYIPKPGRTELRPLSVPSYLDRVVQHLYLIVLNVFMEEFAERHSFGFRPFRSPGWAQKAVTLQMWSRKGYGPYKYAIELDIRKCFDTISHKYMREHVAIQQIGNTKVTVIPDHIITQWLQSGFVDVKGTLTPKNMVVPTEEGIPQGGPISPTIANMVLNGMEKVAQEAAQAYYDNLPLYQSTDSKYWITPEHKITWYYQGKALFCTFGIVPKDWNFIKHSYMKLLNKKNTELPKSLPRSFFVHKGGWTHSRGDFSYEIHPSSNIGLSKRDISNLKTCTGFRFADDAIFFANSEEAVDSILKAVDGFLEKRGLKVNRDKTHIRNLLEGESFQFVGFEFKLKEKMDNYSFYVFPPETKYQNIKRKISEAYYKHKLSPYAAFYEVNAIVRGWCSFYRTGNSKLCFSNLRHWLWHRTRRFLWSYLKRSSKFKIKSQRHYKKGMGFEIYNDYRFPSKNSPTGAKWWGIPHRLNTSTRYIRDKEVKPYMLVNPGEIKVSTPSIITGLSAYYPEERYRLNEKAMNWRFGIQEKLLTKQKGLCKLCSCCLCDNLETLENHHIQPLSMQGARRLTNMAILCRECHADVTTTVAQRDISKIIQLEDLKILQNVSSYLLKDTKQSGETPGE